MSGEAAIDPEEKFEDFFKSFKDQKNELKYRRKIQQLSIENKISIIVDFDDLLRYDADIARELLLKPEDVIKAADQAVMTVLELEDREYFEKLKNEDRALFVRFRNLPSINHIPLRKIRSEHIGMLVMIDGILTRASEVKPRLVEAAFECLRCHYRNFVRQETTEIIKPIICENTNCRRNGPFRLINEESKFEDWQKIRVQEKPEELPPGQLPRAIDAILTHDLVDSARPGDRVSIIGILRSTPEYAGRTKLSTFKIYLEANYIDITEKELEKTEITPEDEQKILEISRDPEIHNKIIKSIAPSIYGLEDVKEAIALQLFGGVSKVLPDSMKIRGESNILLVGDPGTAKCLAPGALVLMASGEKRRIEELVEENLEKNMNIIDDGYYANGSAIILTMNRKGRIEPAEANIFWKRSTPSYMINIKTELGKEITVTPTHPFYTTNNGVIFCKKAEDLSLEDFIATPKLDTDNKNGLNIIPGLKQLLKKVREERNLQINQMGIPELLYKKYENGDLEASLRDLKKIIEKVKKHGSSESLQRLIMICESHILWDKITKIERVKPTSQWVYDLQVPGSNNFIANDFYVHNSQILQYTAQLAPRGLYTSGKGSSAAGLCVAPDTIIVKDETPYEIGKLVEERLNEGVLKIQEGVYKVNPKTEIKIKTINPFKNVDKKVTGLWKIKTPEKLVKILTHTGREITLTPETKMKTFENGLIYWKKAADFTVNDYLAAARRITYNGRRINILELIGESESVEAGVLKTFLKKIFEKLNDKNILENIKNQSISELDKVECTQTVENCDIVRIPLKEFIKYSKNAGYELNHIIQNIREYYEGEEIRLKTPTYLNWEIMYITGLVAGSRIYNKTLEPSDIIKFTARSRELASLFNKIVKQVFNIIPEETKTAKNLSELAIRSKTVTEIINKTGLTIKENKIIDLSDLTLSLKETELAAFISGLFDYLADISLTRNRTPIISIKLPSKTLARKIQLAFLRYGIISKLNIEEASAWSKRKHFKIEETAPTETYKLTISGLELVNYRDKIGFRLKRKIEKLEKAVEQFEREKIYSKNITWNTPVYYKFYNKQHSPSVEKLSEEQTQQDIFWDRVKNIEFLNSNLQWVYDVTVEDSHSFIANGLLVHNTAAVLKDESGAMALEAGALVLADKGLACLHPDTRVLFNGEFTPISRLFNDSLKNKAVSGGELIEIAPLNGYVISFDPSSLSSVKQKTSIIRRKWYHGEIIKLTFKSGFKINLTPEHNIIDGDRLEWRMARRFKLGEHAAAPLKIPVSSIKIHIFDLIPEAWSIIITREMQKILEYKRFEPANKKERGGNYHNTAPLNITTVGEFKKRVNFKSEKLYPNIPLIFYFKNHYERLNTPHLTPETAYLIGFAYASGYKLKQVKNQVPEIKIKCSDEERAKLLINTVKKTVNIDCSINITNSKNKESANKPEIILTLKSSILGYLIKYFLEDSLRRILKLSEDCIKGFIGGVIDSAASISKEAGFNKYIKPVVYFHLPGGEKEATAFILVLHSINVYSELDKKSNQTCLVKVTGLDNIQQLYGEVKDYSVKISGCAQKTCFYRFNNSNKELIEGNVNISTYRTGLTTVSYIGETPPAIITEGSLEEFTNSVNISGFDNPVNSNIIANIQLRGDYYRDRIILIEKDYYEGWVYDLYVDITHNFLAEGIWVHNCIDEFDKMNPQDRVAIHEAMEQRTVSIAKAGIIATLNARTSILAAANPALGRYSEYRSPADNIKLPATLLSRFDLIFIVTDKPDIEKDRKIAEHILSLHRRESVEPPLDIEFLRKYITYAKRNCSPSISPEAAKKIQEFYLDMRKTGEGADSPVPITARQLEALIRLVESRARMALKKEATVEDTEAVIRLVKSCLHQVGVDKETGKMDIDILMTGAPKSQRDRLSALLDVISTLEKEQKGAIPIQDVIERAKEYQLEEGFVKEALQRLLNDGTIFEPEPGYIRRTQ